MAHEKLRPDYLFDEEKIAQLKQLAPECFEDGKINFETLRENLGDWTQNEEDPELEHFGLFWPGKRDARRAAAIPPEGTLEPVWGEGLKADGTSDTDGTNDSKNIFIEGENLEVLKLLQKSYAGKVKMIYIDPPYNTGNDFVYDDDFTEPLQEYLRRTGQVDEEGKAMTSNKRSDGRFHSKWLSMMYPRLRLARNLLREDGVIFVSIDDNEFTNLKFLMVETFGEENYVTTFPWRKRTAKSDVPFGISQDYEWILVFTKGNFEAGKSSERKYLSSPDYESKWRLSDLTKQCSKEERPNSFFDLVNPRNGNSYPANPNRVWAITSDTFQEYYDKGKIVFPGDYPFLNISKPAYRVFEEEDIAKNLKKYGSSETKMAISTLLPADIGRTEDGTKDIDKLFGQKIFPFPKPVSLLKFLLNTFSDDECIVIDFFSGSGSSAQSVLEFNLSESSKRTFVAVQFPEVCEEKSEAFKAGYSTIAEICKERIRRVSSNLKNDNESVDVDLGFKVFSLTPSNYKSWKNYQGTSTQDLENQLDLFNQNPLREGYTKDGLLSEVILIEGFTLCSDISILKEIETNSIKRITSEYCEHALLVCLDETIHKETIAKLHLGDADVFICLDSAVSTEDKLRLSDKGLIKTI